VHYKNLMLISIIILVFCFNCATYMIGRDTSTGEGIKMIESEWKSPFFNLPKKGVGNIDFYTDFSGFWKEGIYNIEMFFSFELDRLIFLKTEDEKYSAEYSIRLICYDKDENYVFDKKWEEDIKASNYELTKTERVITRKSVFQIEPGEYIFVYLFEDKNSDIEATGRIDDIIIKPYNENDILLSDIGFASYRQQVLEEEKIDTSGKSYERLQYVDRLFTDSLYIYFEIYNNDGPIKVEYSIFDNDGKQVLPETLRTDTIMNIKIKTFDVSPLASGPYILNIEAYTDSLSTGISKQFRIYMGAIDLSGDFDGAIRLIEAYIRYEKNSLEKLKNSEPGKNRREAWEEFWSQFDPSPLSEENEYLDEFIRRVNFVDDYFTSLPFKGSFTDMGRVYICLGPPDAVYYETMRRGGNAYEVWEYYRSFRYVSSRRFVFYDIVGLGVRADYRLVSDYSLPRWYEF
jgi:GWxTD domain-containing protein